MFLCVGGEGPPLETNVLSESVHCNDMMELAPKHNVSFGKQTRFSFFIDSTAVCLRFLWSPRHNVSFGKQIRFLLVIPPAICNAGSSCRCCCGCCCLCPPPHLPTNTSTDSLLTCAVHLLSSALVRRAYNPTLPYPLAGSPFGRGASLLRQEQPWRGE